MKKFTKRKPINALVPQLIETALALNTAEQIIQDSLKTNFPTTIKHRQQKHIATDVKHGAILRLLQEIRKEFNVK